MHGLRHGGGFTLIESMVVMAVIAILAAVAMPSYQEYVRKGRRADAQAFMQEVAARQQHFLVDRRAYAQSITAAPGGGGLGMTLPSNVANHYNLELTVDNSARPPTFRLEATPKGRQGVEKCGTLAVDQSGTRTASGTGTCW